MDRLEQLVARVKHRLFLVVLLQNVLVASVCVAGLALDINWLWIAAAAALTALISNGLISGASARFALVPLSAVWRAVMHVAPGNHPVAAPNIDKLKVGRELVAGLTSQIYQFASQATTLPGDSSTRANEQAEAILLSLPLPLLVLDHDQTIIYANKHAATYLGTTRGELVSKNFNSIANLSFNGEETLDSWLGVVKSKKAMDGKLWTRVRLKAGEATKQFDLAATYSRDNPVGAETTLLLFDHTELYGQDDQGLSFVALSVHELRTPLTLLRGYIEVFEDELGSSLTPELQDFMHKMNASAQQLTAFVSNILNVARVENDQLTLSLEKADWKEVLQTAVGNLKLRAAVRGIELTCHVDDNLPPVGVDRVSAYEVLNNLIDNAVKYSDNSEKIAISSQLGKDGLVETTVQDWGVGIPTDIMPNLFTRFYRNYHNRAQIGGTGLGLYLCKAIISAHGGNIWARSHEGQGSTFGFTLLPYDQLTAEQRAGTSGITRGAHGWIKNHSLYRS